MDMRTGAIAAAVVTMACGSAGVAQAAAPCRALTGYLHMADHERTLINANKPHASLTRALKAVSVPYDITTLPGHSLLGRYIYKRLDLNADGRRDSILQDCGEGSHPVCTLSGRISNGVTFEKMIVPALVIHLKQGVFGLISDTDYSASGEKSVFQRYFALDARGYHEVCRKNWIDS